MRESFSKNRNYIALYSNVISFSYFFSTETYLVTGLSMIAEVGGMAGLLLGVSFFHVTKLIEFLIDRHIEKLQQTLKPNLK